MKKLFSLAILAMLMATPLFLVSCGEDDGQSHSMTMAVPSMP